MLTKERLKEILNDHFNYEVLELVCCKQFHKLRVNPELAQAFVNMNLEHTLLHSRNLYEFYFRLKIPPRYRDSDYPRANMYVLGFRVPPFTTNITEQFWEKSSNQILHLGLDRTSNVSEKFNSFQTIGIANDLLVITKDFVDQLEAESNGFYMGLEMVELKKNIDAFIQL